MNNTSSATTEQSLLSAARRLIEAFARHDTKAYFAAFAAEASFIFHTTDTVLNSRSDYERLWQEWEQALGFHVLSCDSTDQKVQLLGNVGIFHHRVHTCLQTHDGPLELDERESIVFTHQADGQWLAVHEHLSPAPVTLQEK
jgi:ketosteroid isomerase-like protein